MEVFDDFADQETHANNRFFPELCAALRDHGASCNPPNVAKSVATSTKVVFFIQHYTEEATLKEFKDTVSQAKRQSGIISTRDTTTTNITQPGNVTLTTQPSKLFVLGMQSLLTKLEQAYSLDNIAGEEENEVIYLELIPQEKQRARPQHWSLEAGVPVIKRRKAKKPVMHTGKYTPQDTIGDQNRQKKVLWR